MLPITSLVSNSNSIIFELCSDDFLSMSADRPPASQETPDIQLLLAGRVEKREPGIACPCTVLLVPDLRMAMNAHEFP